MTRNFFCDSPNRATAAASAPAEGRDEQVHDDEAVAKALQDEYDREHSDLRQQANTNRWHNMI